MTDLFPRLSLVALLLCGIAGRALAQDGGVARDGGAGDAGAPADAAPPAPDAREDPLPPGTQIKKVREGLEEAELPKPKSRSLTIAGFELPTMLNRPIASIQLTGEVGRWWDNLEVMQRAVADDVGERWFFTPPPAPDAPHQKRPPSSEERLAHTFANLGYDYQISVKDGPKGVNVTIKLLPSQFVRIVRVYGNWPLFEDEIKRRLRFRSGVKLPPAGAERVAAFEGEKQRIHDYLKGEGYFESTASVEVKPLGHPGQVKLIVRVTLGRTYRWGKLEFSGNKALDDDTLEDLMLPKWHERDWAPPFHQLEQLANLDITSAKSISKVAPPIPGWYREAFSTERLQQRIANVKKEYQRRGYAAVRVYPDFDEDKSIDKKLGVVNLKLKIKEGKKVEAAFRGNGKLTDDELKKVLVFNEEGSYDDVTIDECSREIQRLYQQNGHFKVIVRGSVGESTEKVQKVVFTVVEGPEMRVKEVLFQGNEQLKTPELKDVVQTKVYPPLGTIGLGEGGYATSAQIEKDTELLKTYYRVHGYPEAEIDGDLAPNAEALDRAGVLAALESTVDKPDALYVRYTIDEGPRKVVDRVVIAFNGQHRAQADSLARRLTLKPDSTYTTEAFNKDRDAIERAYKEIGHRNAVVKGDVEPDPDDPWKLRVVWTIDEKRPVRIGEILIRGNYHTAQRVLRREIDLRRGDLYEESKVERMEKNLRATGLFNSVRLSFLRAASDPQTVHIVIEVEERYDDYGTLELGGGYATDALGYVTAGYLNRNIFGGAYLFEARGTYGQKLWEVTTSFVWARFLDSRFRLELKGEARSEETVRLGLIQTEQVITTLKREVLPRANVFLQWNLKQVTRPEDLIRIAGASDDSTKFNTQTFVSTMGPGFDIDRRDNPLVPRRGYRGTLVTAFADPHFWVSADSPKYFKVNATAQGYVPLGGQLVVATGLRYDHGFPLGGAVVMPKTERFFAGGDTTVRGIDADMLRTQNACIERFSGAGEPCLLHTRRAAGGNIRIIHNLELEFPWLPSKKVPIGAALFLDTGLVADSFAGFSLRSFRHSVGFAPIRVKLPIGFLSFEYAFPLDPEPGDDPTGRFHFNFGFVF